MKRFQTFACPCVLLLTIGLIGCSKSDPKVAVKNLSDAMHKGDAAAVKAGSINADPAFIDGMTAVATSTNKLHAAAVAKFGTDGEALGVDRMPDIARQMDDADVKIDGDTATVTPKGNPMPVTLKKVGGEWKVDFASLAGMKEAEGMGPMFKSMADANSEVADEIAAGKYASAAEAKKAVGQKMMSAMMGGMK